MVKGDYYKRRSMALKELERQVKIAVKETLELDMEKVLHEFTQFYAIGKKPLIEAMEFFEERFDVKVDWGSYQAQEESDFEHLMVGNVTK